MRRFPRTWLPPLLTAMLSLVWACSERPEVWEWNLSFWLRSLAP